MSHISTGALGLIAASLAYGGVQFGMASDGVLARAVSGNATLRENVSHDVAFAVNRDAKADRDVIAAGPRGHRDPVVSSAGIEGWLRCDAFADG